MDPWLAATRPFPPGNVIHKSFPSHQITFNNGHISQSPTFWTHAPLAPPTPKKKKTPTKSPFMSQLWLSDTSNKNQLIP